MNLNGTIKKTQALSGRLVKSSGGGGSVQEIYWVQYGVGTATNAEVNEAVAANKLPICYWDSTNAYGQTTRRLYFLIRHTPTEALFATVDSTNETIIVRRLYADEWNTQTIRYEGKLTWDQTPRFGSVNPVTSGGIYNALQNATVSDERIAEAVDDWMDANVPSIGTLSYAAKQALLNCFAHVAWIDNQGQTYYNALESELFPDATLESITAVFTQGSATIYDTDSLDTLKQYLTVTATYADSTTATVTDYTLSGTLTAGTSTITATYGGKSAIFTVTVVEWLTSITAVFAQGSATIYDTDTLDTLKQYLTVTANYADGTHTILSSEEYTLSGSLEEGTSVITVGYANKSATFNVSVTHQESPVRAVEYVAGAWAIRNYTPNRDYIASNSTSARARSLVPIENHNYYFTVTDSDKYSIAIYGVTSLEEVEIDGVMYYPGTDNDVSWATGGGRDTPYVAISLKKNDNTEFTAEELANGAEAVFTYTENLWTFTNGYALGKGSSGTTNGKIWRSSATGRAAGKVPIENNEYVFTVTDAAKYNLAAYDVADDTPISTTYSGAVDKQWYQGGSKTISWKTSDSATTPYVWVSLKKIDGTAFTDEELANGAAAVFTYTEGS